MSENYITIEEGIWNGVSYRINDAKVTEENGKCQIMLDYDVKNLDEKDSPEFETFLGGLIEEALEKELNRLESKDNKETS